ncbi:MAG: AAA family ATPase, partial [Candidatus Omnitrophota bacterium]
MSVVYRAEDINSQSACAVKFLKENLISKQIDDLIRFQRETQIVAKLNHHGIVKVYCVGDYNNMPFIVMDLLEGKTLSESLKSGNKFTVIESVAIVLKIAKTLDYVHAQGIVHRDLKPANIFLIKQNNEFEVKLLDFGLSRILELEKIKDRNEIAGTFGYMSPEQTGILKRQIDERSDLYSLGVVFYQLITDSLPFKADDIGSLVHQQVAKIPAAPAKIITGLPKVINQIIIKALDKDPDRRYQSAGGLSADLEKFQKGELDFSIGSRDRMARIIYQTRLIGRDNELSKLKEMFNYARDSRGCACFIAGEAGRGKSRLVNELRRHIYEHGGIVISGKCYRQENKAPYQPFKEALAEYVDMAGKLPPGAKEEAVKKNRLALGDLGEVVFCLTPLMKNLLGEFPPLVELDPEKENQRFLNVASKFLCDLGDKDKPLIIFLDDIQWADDGTLTLIHEILSRISQKPLFIIGTYRDNEVNPSSNLIKIIRTANESNFPLNEIFLGLFNLESTEEMIACLLFEDKNYLRPLSEYIYNQSKGNPYFTIEVVRQLVDEKVLSYEDYRWRFDEGKLRTVSIPATLVDTVLRRIKLLDQNKLELFSYAAVIGREFDMELLYLLSNRPQEDIVDAVDEAIFLQLLERDPKMNKIIFIHERIRAAFYSRLADKDKIELHMVVAQAIEEFNKADREEVFFDLAHHYTQAKDIDKGIYYSLRAGEKAKSAFANDEAIRYFSNAAIFLEQKDALGSDNWVKAREQLGEIYHIKGDFAKSIAIFNELLRYKENAIEKASLLRRISYAYTKMSDFISAKKEGIKALELLGNKFPDTKFSLIAAILKQLHLRFLYSFFPCIFTYKSKKPPHPKYHVIIWLHHSIGWSSALADMLEMVYASLIIYNVAQRRIGKSREMAMGICTFSNTQMVIPLFKLAIKNQLKSLQMRKELGDVCGVAQNYKFMGFTYIWMGQYQKGIDCLNESLNIFSRIGDRSEVGFVFNPLLYGCFLSGDLHKAFEVANQYLQLGIETKDDWAIWAAKGSFLPMIYVRLGEIETAEQNATEGITYVDQNNNLHFLSFTIRVRLGYVYLEKKDFTKAVEFLTKAFELSKTRRYFKEYVNQMYYPLIEALIGEYLDKKAKKFTPKQKEESLRHIKKMCAIGLKKTKSWKNHHALLFVAAAKYYSLINRKNKASDYFLKSIVRARKLGQRFELAKGHYEYGLWLKDMEKEKESRKELEKAYAISKEIGAKLYIKRAADLLEYKDTDITTDTYQERLRTQQEMTSLIKVSQHISSILRLDELLEKVMDSALEVLGAQSGF